MSALDDHLRANAVGPEELVFRAPEDGPVRLASWRRRFWAPAVGTAGFEPLRPHDLRHTAVALWIAAGASPKEIATRAGHTSVVTVLDRYGHLLPGSEERVNDALDAMAAEVPQSSAAISTNLLRVVARSGLDEAFAGICDARSTTAATEAGRQRPRK